MGWRVEEEGERRQGARGRGGGWRGWRAGAAVVEVVVRETSPMPGLHARCHRRFGLPHSAPMSSGADPPRTPAENRTPRGDNAAWSSGPSAQSAREESRERELARQRGALAGGRHGDIPGRSARDEDGHLSSDPSPSRSRFSIFFIFQVVDAESGPATEGGLQLEKYGVLFLNGAVVHCHKVADGHRALRVRQRGEMGWQCARERYVGP